MEDEKIIYTPLEIEIIEFNTEDIIITSTTSCVLYDENTLTEDYQ